MIDPAVIKAPTLVTVNTVASDSPKVPATTPIPIAPGIAVSAKPATPIPNVETAAMGITQSFTTSIVSFKATLALIVKWTAPVSL